MPASVRPPLKYFGGKQKLALAIVALTPPHLSYLEPFFGGGAVLFGRDPDDRALWWAQSPGYLTGVSETANDINHRLMNFYRVLRDPGTFERFRRLVQLTPFGRDVWQEANAHEYGKDLVADAWATFVHYRQSRGGQAQGFKAICTSRTRRQMHNNASEWLGCIEGLPDAHVRLQRVCLECLPAIQFLEKYCRAHSPAYCDPPYPPDTRFAKKVYEYEMTEADHVALLQVLRHCPGKVILSSYPSQLYAELLLGWHKAELVVKNDASGKAEKDQETEVLWCNFPIPQVWRDHYENTDGLEKVLE